MAYEPTEWARGTKITAQKLNNIERGVESVNSEYTPTTWAEGDIVTATKLNNIEQGIANAGGGGGGGDFSLATVTPLGFGARVIGAFVDSLNPYRSIGEITLSDDPEQIILYKGVAYMAVDPASEVTVTEISGAIEETPRGYVITGDCSITFEEVV